MWVVKVTQGETTRRIILDEPYTYERLRGMVQTRFELSSSEFDRAALRYTDPDGDEVCVSSEEEFAEALSLLKNVDPPLVRMTLKVAPERTQAATATWANSLGGNAAAPASPTASSEDSDVVFIDQDDATTKEETDAEAKERDEALKAAAKAAEEEQMRKQKEDEETANALAQLEEERLAELARKIEEAQRLDQERFAEEARLAEEDRLEQLRKEEELRHEELRKEEERLALERAEEERLQAAAQQREDERLSRISIALIQCDDEAIARVTQLLDIGCTYEQLEMIFSTRILDMQRREVRNNQEEVDSPSAQAARDLEVAVEVVNDIMDVVEHVTGQEDASTAEEEAEVEGEEAPEEPAPFSLEPSLLGASACDSEEPVSVSAPSSASSTEIVESFITEAAAPEVEPAVESAVPAEPLVHEPSVPAPVSEVPASIEPQAEEVMDAPAPEPEFVEAAESSEQQAADDLAIRLGAFYLIHNPLGIENIPALVKDFGGREAALNGLLMAKYKCDLSSIRAESDRQADRREEPAAAAMDVSHEEEEAAVQPEEKVEEDSEEMRKLMSMGFYERERNAELLAKHSNDVSKVIDELLGA